MKKLPFKLWHVLPCGLFITAKWWYKMASTANLMVFLKPVAWLISMITGDNYQLKTAGFLFPDLNILIDKSCAGFNLFLIYFMMFSWVLIMRFPKTHAAIISIIISSLLAYIATIISNACRIYCLLIVQEPLSDLVALNPALIHESVGIVNNLTFLIISFSLINHLLKKLRHEKFA